MDRAVVALMIIVSSALLFALFWAGLGDKTKLQELFYKIGSGPF
jgi:hypothetical protein